jgi:molybdate transport system substrate-binding protein
MVPCCFFKSALRRGCRQSMCCRDLCRNLGVVALLFLTAIAAAFSCATAAGTTIFAAASLKDALDDVTKTYEQTAGNSVVVSYAASSVLAKQIEQGAPADVFISADLDWMDYLAERQLIRPDTRFNLLGNRLVLIAPKGSTLEAKIAPGFPLAALLGDGRLAMANTDSVPAGKYGKAALQTLGVWDQVKDKIAQAENARAALLLVSRGEAPLGIVYTTDAHADPNVKVIGTFPEKTHPPIIYPVAVLAGAKSADAQGFVNYLKTGASKRLFEDQGFEVLSAP